MPPMSELGQFQASTRAVARSALPSQADIVSLSTLVESARFGLIHRSKQLNYSIISSAPANKKCVIVISLNWPA
jgi:hypothetical protein